VQFNQTNETDFENRDGFVFVAFLVGICAFACLFLSAKSGFGLVKYDQLVDQANSTRGVLIERRRVNIASGKGSYQPKFYLRYKFDNPIATRQCPLDIDTKTTPPDQICSVTVARVQVGEKAYKTAKIPSPVKVLYKTSKVGTWSEPREYSTRSRQIGRCVFLGLMSLLLTAFTWKMLRVLIRSPRQPQSIAATSI